LGSLGIPQRRQCNQERERDRDGADGEFGECDVRCPDDEEEQGQQQPIEAVKQDLTFRTQRQCRRHAERYEGMAGVLAQGQDEMADATTIGQVREVGAAPEQAGNPAGILFPPALLRRAARYVSGAADLAANGGKLPDGVPETARNQLVATLRRDADGLIAITTTG